jgi:RNA polymerase sigma factor for flagellar operon FliA
MFNSYETDMEKLISEKTYLVKIVISQMNLRESTVLSYDDYMSLGLIGLFDAIQKYDATKKAKFDTYAKIRIRGKILDEMRALGEISRTKMDDLKQYTNAMNTLRSETMSEPTEEMVLDYTGISRQKLTDIYNMMHFLSKKSLDMEVTEGVVFADTIENTKTPTPEQELLKQEKKEVLIEKMMQLDERLQFILNLIYVEELPLKDIAEILDIGVSRVSQLHGKALLKLRSLMSDY